MSQRKCYHEKKKAEKLTSYRRLQAQLAKTLLQVEQLRMLSVTQRLVNQMQEASYLSGAVELKLAIRDAMWFFDRVEASKTEWTAVDVRRLQQLRAIAKSVTK